MSAVVLNRAPPLLHSAAWMAAKLSTIAVLCAGKKKRGIMYIFAFSLKITLMVECVLNAAS